MRHAADSVRDQVILLLLSMVMLVTVVASAGAVAVTTLTDDVDVLVNGLRPGAYGNIELRNRMATAQSSARGWALSGNVRFAMNYEVADRDARDQLVRLRRLTHDDPVTRERVLAQQSAARDYLDFSSDLVAGAPGPVPPGDLDRGQDAFDRFTAHNDSVSDRLNQGIELKSEQAEGRGRIILVVVLLVSLLGLLVTAVLGRNLVRRVSEPLSAMEAGVERLSSGHLDARVGTEGPREIRRVATALNVLAEENQRSREMEAQVVERLTQLDRAKDDFVSTVSHELRTPLTSISGYVELFEEGFVADLTSHQRGMLKVVKRNVDRLRLLIEDLLTLSSVEAETFRTSFDLLDLSHLTSDVAHDVAEMAAVANVRVRSSGPENPVLVEGDAGQLSRALLNLVSNAIKFSPDGAHVLIRLAHSDGKAVVSVVDNGIGIPAPEVANLGTRFFRASNAVEAEITGTGLGLKIVQTIAQNHGGNLEIESTQGEGTTARLVVPLSQGNTSGADDLQQG